MQGELFLCYGTCKMTFCLVAGACEVCIHYDYGHMIVKIPTLGENGHMCGLDPSCPPPLGHCRGGSSFHLPVWYGYVWTGWVEGSQETQLVHGLGPPEITHRQSSWPTTIPYGDDGHRLEPCVHSHEEHRGFVDTHRPHGYLFTLFPSKFKIAGE